MQYEANNPCEDKYIYEQLKSIDAYTVSIFDGHGGP
jgi:serine/threonine protein phosphatase PrpC